MTRVERLEAKVRQKQAAEAARRRRRWAEVERLWEKCCKAERIDTGVEFAGFSQDNPYLAKYQEAIATYTTMAA
jgi:hypothetical protein